MRKTMFLIRGLPGSGKSSLAGILCAARCFRSGEVISTDDFFNEWDEEEKALVYKFNSTKLNEAHAYAQNRADAACRNGTEAVIIANTFSRKWEMKPYLDIAKEYGYTVNVIEMQSMFGSVHNVPEGTIQRMKDRWERDF